MKYATVVFLAAFLLALIGCSGQSTHTPGVPANALGALRTVECVIAKQIVTIEIAITPREQRQGLMYRESMPTDHGMLFVYREPQYMSFWMKNTKIPLSIAYIRDDGVIGNIEKMEPHRGPFDPVVSYRSKYKSLYALEMNQGWFEANGLKPGEPISLPYDEIQRMVNDVMAKAQ